MWSNGTQVGNSDIQISDKLINTIVQDFSEYFWSVQVSLHGESQDHYEEKWLKIFKREDKPSRLETPGQYFAPCSEVSNRQRAPVEIDILQCKIAFENNEGMLKTLGSHDVVTGLEKWQRNIFRRWRKKQRLFARDYGAHANNPLCVKAY